MEEKPSLWQVVMSVLAALFGVQSAKSRERDFTKGNPWVYVVVGLVLVTLFVLLLVVVVKVVLVGARH
jgi:uncharacterized membrane protein YidH (DUF202 family)